jgi:hypothetical protein
LTSPKYLEVPLYGIQSEVKMNKTGLIDSVGHPFIEYL